MFSRIIQDLVAEILADVGALYKASEAVKPSSVIYMFFPLSDGRMITLGGTCRYALGLRPFVY